MGLKILHSADWHLDSPFLSFPTAQRDYLRQAQRKLPDLIADLCRRECCDLMLLAGDLFDGTCTTESVELVKDALESCGVPVLIAPGNHDFVRPGAPWLTEQWPANVHIFTGDLEYVDLPELNCRVYGAGYHAMDCPPLLEGFRAEGDGYRLCVLHGDASRIGSPYCPITAAQVEQSGLHYLALGHVHKADGFLAGDTACAWPGCPMGRGWDETGVKGVCIVTVDTQTHVEMRELDTVRFLDLEADVGEDPLAALDALLPATQCGDFYRVTLTGSCAVDIPEMYREFGNLPHLELRDRTQPPLDPWEDVGEDTLRGVFFRMLRDAQQGADEEEARRIRLAAEISKQLLEGREVTLP